MIPEMSATAAQLGLLFEVELLEDTYEGWILYLAYGRLGDDVL